MTILNHYAKYLVFALIAMIMTACGGGTCAYQIPSTVAGTLSIFPSTGISVRVGESQQLTLILNNSSGVSGLTVNVSSNDSIVVTVAPSSCTLSTVSNTCSLTVTGESAGLSGILVTATGYAAVTESVNVQKRFAYITNYSGNSYTQCTVNSTHGTLSACNTVAASGEGALNYPTGIAISNGFAYIINSIGDSYTQCTVNSTNGTLSACNTVAPSGAGALNYPTGIAISNGFAYIINAGNSSYTQCLVNSTDGALSGCNTVTPSGAGALSYPAGIAINNDFAYIINAFNNSYTQCLINSTDGELSGCNTVTPIITGALSFPMAIAISSGFAYIINAGNSSYTQCSVNSADGTLSGCNTVTSSGAGALNYPYGIAIGNEYPQGIAISNGVAYIINSNSNSYTQCTVNSTDGELSGCNTIAPSSPGELNGPSGIAIN